MASSSVVIGAGTIGLALGEFLRGEGKRVFLAARRPPPGWEAYRIDLAEPPDRWTLPDSVEHAFICAAASGLQFCREQPAKSRLINVDATVELAKRLSAAGAQPVFISTNLIFDGRLARCAPQAPRAPQCEYGRQKADAEQRLLDEVPATLILRVTKVIPDRETRLTSWARALADGQPIRAIGDLRFAPLPIADVTNALVQLSAQARTGIWQLSGPKDISWADAARIVARSLGADPAALVTETSTKSLGIPASESPAHTTLDDSATRDLLKLPIIAAADVIKAAIGNGV